MSSKEKLGIKIFGIINLTFGLGLLVTFSLGFFMGVILGWVTDFGFHDAYDKFISLIVGRLLSDIRYIFSFLLLFSGIGMLSMKNYSRKLAIFSIIVIISTLLLGLLLAVVDIIFYPDIIFEPDYFYVVPFLIFLIYSIFLIRYLNKPKIKEIFNDKDVKLSFKIPIIVIIVAYIFPLFLKYFVLFLGNFLMESRDTILDFLDKGK